MKINSLTGRIKACLLGLALCATLPYPVMANRIGFGQASEQWVKQIRALGYYAFYPMKEEFKPGSILMFTSTLPGYSYYYGEGALARGWPIPILGPIPPLAPLWTRLSRYTRDGFGHPKPEVIYLGDMDLTPKLQMLADNDKVLTNNKVNTEAYAQYHNGVENLFDALDQADDDLGATNINNILKKDSATFIKRKDFLNQTITQLKVQAPGDHAAQWTQIMVNAIATQLNELQLTSPIGARTKIIWNAIAPSKPAQVSIEAIDHFLAEKDTAASGTIIQDSITGNQDKLNTYRSLLQQLKVIEEAVKTLQAPAQQLFSANPGQLRRRVFPAFTLKGFTLAEAAAIVPIQQIAGLGASLGLSGGYNSNTEVNINITEAYALEVPIDQLQLKSINNGEPPLNIAGTPFKPAIILKNWGSQTDEFFQRKKRFRFLIAREVIYIKKADITLADTRQVSGQGVFQLLGPGKKAKESEFTLDKLATLALVKNLFPTDSKDAFTPEAPKEFKGSAGGRISGTSISGQQNQLKSDNVFDPPIPFAFMPIYVQVDRKTTCEGNVLHNLLLLGRYTPDHCSAPENSYKITKVLTHIAY